jgi:hypothetical protein
MKEVKFKISYKKGDADKGRLDMYDASNSLQGFAKALSITTHALLNNGEIKKQGNKIIGANLYIQPSRKGSFEELITLAIEEKVALSIGASVVANVFYDLIKWTWSHTFDQDYSPQTPQVRKLKDRVEPFISEMDEALEIPLEQAHRPIKKHKDMTISIVRPKVGDIVKLDIDTLKSVSILTEPNIIKGVIGNITRYNILSVFGRFFDDALDRTVSFKLQNSVNANQKQLLTWSMHHAQNGDGGKLKFEVQRVMSAKGVIKRYLISNVEQA